jgi:MFS family permease
VLVALGLNQHIEDFAHGVDGAPQVNHPPIDFQIDFVALMMIVGRLLGDSVVRAVGRTRIILYGVAVLFVGIGLATGPVSEPSAVVGFALTGLGVANMVPAAFSASATAASSPSFGIAMSATMAYASLLIGPPLFGAIATVSSLRLAFAILLLAAAGIAALAFSPLAKILAPLGDAAARLRRSWVRGLSGDRFQYLERPTPSDFSPNASHASRRGDEHVA